MENQKNILDYDTVALDEAQDAVIIIDQTLLPGKIELIAVHTAQEMWDAIYLLKVRGAPAIGVAAALGIPAGESHRDGRLRRILSEIHRI